MTIPEASSLVLKAGGVGSGGEVYLLDMGDSVSITELAEQMIRFYGYEPKDIGIVYTGLARERSCWRSSMPTRKSRAAPRIRRS